MIFCVNSFPSSSFWNTIGLDIFVEPGVGINSLQRLSLWHSINDFVVI